MENNNKTLKEQILNSLKQNPGFMSAIETKTKEEQDVIYADIEKLAESFDEQLHSIQSIFAGIK